MGLVLVATSFDVLSFKGASLLMRCIGQTSCPRMQIQIVRNAKNKRMNIGSTKVDSEKQKAGPVRWGLKMELKMEALTKIYQRLS